MSFHLYRITELYSNPSGTIQFIELAVGNASGESFWAGISLSSTRSGVTNRYIFPDDLPSTATANTTVLIATRGFADLGLVTPDFIVPDGFLFPAGGSLNFGGVDIVTYAALPADGVHSVTRTGSPVTATPTNFAGLTGSLPAPITPLVGTGGDDSLVGTANADEMEGLAGNDILEGKAGDDSLDGGPGIDAAVFGVVRAAATVNRTATGHTVTSALEGTDTLVDVERLKFSDIGVALDVGVSQAAGQTVLLLGAALPGQLVYDPSKQVLLGAVIDLFDAGYSLRDLSGAILRLPVWDVLTGKAAPTHLDIANYLLTNVNGVAPDQATLDAAINALDTESFQGEWLAGLAGSAANQLHVGLVGLMDSGLEFVPLQG